MTPSVSARNAARAEKLRAASVACIGKGWLEHCAANTFQHCLRNRRAAIWRREFAYGDVMTDASAAGAAAAQGIATRWPRLALLIAAAFEFLTGLADLPVLFGDISQVPGPGIGGAIIVAKIALSPLVALVALFFTVRGRMLYAILAMAAVMLLTWVSFLPSVAINGLESAGVAGAVTIYQVILVPLIGLAAIVLALRGRRAPAIILVVLPTFVNVAAGIAFAIGVAIYGF
jgi:hypothetical protein